jgi:hypothetical protein
VQQWNPARHEEDDHEDLEAEPTDCTRTQLRGIASRVPITALIKYASADAQEDSAGCQASKFRPIHRQTSTSSPPDGTESEAPKLLSRHLLGKLIRAQPRCRRTGTPRRVRSQETDEETG